MMTGWAPPCFPSCSSSPCSSTLFSVSTPNLTHYSSTPAVGSLRSYHVRALPLSFQTSSCLAVLPTPLSFLRIDHTRFPISCNPFSFHHQLKQTFALPDLGLYALSMGARPHSISIPPKGKVSSTSWCLLLLEVSLIVLSCENNRVFCLDG